MPWPKRLPRPPRDLDPVAREKFQELAPLVSAADYGDPQALAAYCAEWSLMLQAQLDVNQRGITLPGRKRAGVPEAFCRRANPSVRIVFRRLRTLLRLGAPLGLTPLDRANLERQRRRRQRRGKGRS
jgi:phage terminase small subunit